MEFGGEEKTHACGVSSDLHIKSHVVFACGSIEYLSETVATSEDGVMVKLVESMVWNILDYNMPSVLFMYYLSLNMSNQSGLHDSLIRYAIWVKVSCAKFVK